MVQSRCRGADEYNDALVVREYYDVYHGSLANRATILIVPMELCRWDTIPQRLWRPETNRPADQFRHDREDYFGSPTARLEFVAYYFALVGKAPPANWRIAPALGAPHARDVGPTRRAARDGPSERRE